LNKQEEEKILRIEKSDSPTAQPRSRLDSSGTAAANTQSNQTTSQNVLWLCKSSLIQTNQIIFSFIISS
jgi:hypothetical protein